MALCQPTSMLNGTPLSRAGSLPQWFRVCPQDQVGCQAAFAGKPAPTGGLRTSVRDRSAVWPPSLASQLLQGVCVHPSEIGRLSGRLRWQASSYKGSAYTDALHHSSGRALARLLLLILIHPPLREAEWRCASGEWRAAPFDAVEHAACRSSRSRPEGSVPGWMPERRNAEP
ncbi:hypothetical protein J2W17_002016 [Pseudomonas lini]|nr:hypothetical protein [Pseudomonas lini]